MVDKTITQAEGTTEAAAVNGGQAPPAPAALSVDALQSRIADMDKEIATLQSQLKGRATENVKLRKAQEDRQTLKTELRAEIEEVIHTNFAALGETLFADEEGEVAPPSKKQLFLSKLKAPQKPPQQEVDPKLYAESLRYSGRLDALEETTGVKVSQLPEESVAELKELWNSGDFKGAYEGIKESIKTYQTKQAEKAAEAVKERERVAKQSTVPKIPSSGVSVTGRKPSLEELRESSPDQTGRKVQSGEWILPGWIQ